ncbi:MAG: hypothetical protein OHK0013_46910 [Sandaracinaceae bacterium]
MIRAPLVPTRTPGMVLSAVGLVALACGAAVAQPPSGPSSPELLERVPILPVDGEAHLRVQIVEIVFAETRPDGRRWDGPLDGPDIRVHVTYVGRARTIRCPDNHRVCGPTGAQASFLDVEVSEAMPLELTFEDADVVGADPAGSLRITHLEPARQPVCFGFDAQLPAVRVCLRVRSMDGSP